MANVEHSALTGTDLHEPKGIAAAAANRVYLSNGAASGSWTTVPAAAITAAGVLVFQSQLYHIRDERSSGTDGDTLSLATWNTRTLQTEKTDDLTVTTTGSQISLAAGTYWINAEAVATFKGDNNNTSNPLQHKLRLRNISDSTTLVNGISYRIQVNDGTNVNKVDWSCHAELAGRFTLSGTKLVELQSWINANLFNGQTYKGGVAVSSGENEVYADVKIWKLS